MKELVSKIRKTRDYENLKVRLGDELGSLIYKLVNNVGPQVDYIAYEAEKFEFGEKVDVWDRFEDRYDEAYFVADIGGLYPYLVVYEIDEIDSLRNGYHIGAHLVVSYMNCKKSILSQKYKILDSE